MTLKLCDSCEWYHIEEELEYKNDRWGRQYYICQLTLKKVIVIPPEPVQPVPTPKVVFVTPFMAVSLP